jgi:hypothetical protein
MSISRRAIWPRMADHASRRPRAVAIDAQHPRRDEFAGKRGLDPLRSLPYRCEILVTALWAGRRDGPLVAAVVAAHPLILQVQHQLRGATVTTRDPSAAPAGQNRSKAAAVDEYHALLPPRARRPYRFQEARGQPAAGALRPGVQGLDRWRGRPDALRQCVKSVAPGDRIMIGLQRRRRGPQHDGDVTLPGAHDGEIARRIAKSLGLLERGIVLLVDDDDPQRGHRREYGEPGSEDDTRPS